jgi:hypothetical protein
MDWINVRRFIDPHFSKKGSIYCNMQLLAQRSSGDNMKVVMFGASGTVGQGVLQECLRDQEVQLVVSVVRAATGKQHEKLHEIVHQNFLDLSAIEQELTGLDAGLFCLGVSENVRRCLRLNHLRLHNCRRDHASPPQSRNILRSRFRHPRR